MTLDYIHRPLGDRSSFTGEHRPSPFDSTHQQTMILLQDELWHIDGDNVVIELDVVPSQIRRDGQLKEGSRVLSPAVRLVFDSVHGQLTYATDVFVRNYKGPRDDWRHNLRAIALGLEALRKVDRYGIARHGEQYSGYAALPAGTGAVALGGMSKDQALTILTKNAVGAGPTNAFSLEQLYRRARARTHPDRHNGSQTLWDETELAAKVLGLNS